MERKEKRGEGREGGKGGEEWAPPMFTMDRRFWLWQMHANLYADELYARLIHET